MRPNRFRYAAPILGLVVLTLLAMMRPLMAEDARRADISAFVGDYTGSAEVVSADGSTAPRNMSVSIAQTSDGFTVAWSTVTIKSPGESREKTYEIMFLPSDREGIYAAAMKRNVFGHAVQLDPMKGEPFVWGRISGDTMTVYSLFVDNDGGYEMQQYDRTLVDGGLKLEFARFRNGENLRSVSAFLERR
jgi:hypothetical protein